MSKTRTDSHRHASASAIDCASAKTLAALRACAGSSATTARTSTWVSTAILIFCPPRRGGARRIDFLDAGALAGPAREQSDEAGNAGRWPGCLEQDPTAGQP